MVLSDRHFRCNKYCNTENETQWKRTASARNI